MIEKYNIKDLQINRGDNKKSFKSYKQNTIKSLKEVEYFLGNWKRVLKGIKLYKILK